MLIPRILYQIQTSRKVLHFFLKKKNQELGWSTVANLVECWNSMHKARVPNKPRWRQVLIVPGGDRRQKWAAVGDGSDWRLPCVGNRCWLCSQCSLFFFCFVLFFFIDSLQFNSVNQISYNYITSLKTIKSGNGGFK